MGQGIVKTLKGETIFDLNIDGENGSNYRADKIFPNPTAIRRCNHTKENLQK